MIRRPPRSTRTDTLFPYTTLFRSFFAGAIDHFERNRFGNATMADLFASWERAGAGDLSNFTSNWLRTAGPDALLLDRQAGAIVKTPPTEHPAKRAHTVQVPTVEPAGEWERAAVPIAEPATPPQNGPDPGVLIHPAPDTTAP